MHVRVCSIANLRELRERNMYLNDLNMYDNSRDLVLQGNYTASQIEYYMTQVSIVMMVIVEGWVGGGWWWWWWWWW